MVFHHFCMAAHEISERPRVDLGGALPAALAADWVVSAWDQNAAFHSLSPAAAAIEEVASAWTLDLLGLPATASVGFVTGGQGAYTMVFSHYAQVPPSTQQTLATRHGSGRAAVGSTLTRSVVT
jgi:hypothetical protein